MNTPAVFQWPGAVVALGLVLWPDVVVAAADSTTDFGSPLDFVLFALTLFGVAICRTRQENKTERRQS
jgi:hypothetical protein